MVGLTAFFENGAPSALFRLEAMTKLNRFTVHSAALLQSMPHYDAIDRTVTSEFLHELVGIVTEHARIESRGPVLLHVSV